MIQRAITFALFSTSIFATEPEKLTKLRGSYESAITKATAPIQKTYAAELEKLKIEFTKAGKLEDALAVDEEIKKNGGTSATPVGSQPQISKTEKGTPLSRKEKEALVQQLDGKWRLPSGRFFLLRQGVLNFDGDYCKCEIGSDGSVTTENKNRQKAVLTPSNDVSSLTGTWFTGEQVIIKKEP